MAPVASKTHSRASSDGEAVQRRDAIGTGGHVCGRMVESTKQDGGGAEGRERGHGENLACGGSVDKRKANDTAAHDVFKRDGWAANKRHETNRNAAGEQEESQPRQAHMTAGTTDGASLLSDGILQHIANHRDDAANRRVVDGGVVNSSSAHTARSHGTVHSAIGLAPLLSLRPRVSGSQISQHSGLVGGGFGQGFEEGWKCGLKTRADGLLSANVCDDGAGSIGKNDVLGTAAHRRPSCNASLLAVPALGTMGGFGGVAGVGGPIDLVVFPGGRGHLGGGLAGRGGRARSSCCCFCVCRCSLPPRQPACWTFGESLRCT